MKYITLLLMLLINNIVFAQDSRLFDNDWYLTNLIINGSDNIPPINDITLTFDQQNSWINTEDNCNNLVGVTIFEQDNLSDFALTNIYQTLSVCPEIESYEMIYFNFFNEDASTNNFSYAISEFENFRTLTIYSMFSKQAVYSSQILSTNDFDTSDFSIYPSPATDEISILTNTNFRNAQMEIYNIWGVRCFSTNIESVQTTIDIEHLSGGVYLAKLKTISGTVLKKFVKL